MQLALAHEWCMSKVDLKPINPDKKDGYNYVTTTMHRFGARHSERLYAFPFEKLAVQTVCVECAVVEKGPQSYSMA